MAVILTKEHKDPRVHPAFEKQIITSSEQARDMQRASTEKKLDNRITAIEQAFKRGEKV